MLTNYKEKCEKIVRDYYENILKVNTRYNEIGDISLENYQESIAEFKVIVTHNVYVNCERSVMKGSTNQCDEKYYQESEYINAIQIKTRQIIYKHKALLYFFLSLFLSFFLII